MSEIIIGLRQTSRYKYNYDFASMAKSLVKSFFSIWNEKNDSSVLKCFNTLKNKTFCKLTFVMGFLLFEFPTHPAVYDRMLNKK